MFLKLCDSDCDCFTNLAPHYGHLTQVSNISFTKQYTDLTCAAVSELHFCSGAYVYIRKSSQSDDLGKHQHSTLNTVTLLHFFLISLWFCLQRSVAKRKFRPTVKAKTEPVSRSQSTFCHCCDRPKFHDFLKPL